MTDDRPVSLAAVKQLLIDCVGHGMARELDIELEALPTVAPATHGGRDIATAIVNSIVSDLSDRRGLRHEWDQIRKEIQEEIRQEWRDIVNARIAEADNFTTPPKPSPTPEMLREMPAPQVGMVYVVAGSEHLLTESHYDWESIMEGEVQYLDRIYWPGRTPDVIWERK